MHLTLRICLGLMLSLISLCSLAQTPEPSLNGIAINSEFGKEQFIGALYSSSLSEKAGAFSSAQSMRMELKIVAAEGITIRRFSRMWIESMSINNDPKLLTAQADNMVLFDSLFKGRLVRNDNVVFSYEQKKGVDISLNNIILGNIPSEEFFDMLLRTWIGTVPLSTDYKNGILKAGQVNTDLKNRFDNIKPTTERSQEIAEWIKTKPLVAIVDNKKASSSSSTSALPIATSKQTATPTLETTEKAVIKPNVAITLATNTNTNTKNEPTTKASTQAPTQEIPKAVGDEDSDEDAPALTAQAVLARQFYTSSLLKKIRSNTQYPSRAYELGQSDSLRIAVVIDRQGKMMATRFVQGSQYALLNQAALEAIKKSTPFPAMPDTIEGKTFEFTVPINFVAAKTK